MEGRGSSGRPAAGDDEEQEREGGTRQRNARMGRRRRNARKGRGSSHSGDGATTQRKEGRGCTTGRRLCYAERGGARGRSVSSAGAWRGGEDSLAAGGRLDFLKQRCRCGIAGAVGEGAREGGNAEALGFGICFIYICYWALQLWADGPEMNRGCGETGTEDALQSPPPPSPTGTTFAPIRSPRGSKFSHTRPLMEEFPVGNWESGPRCHPYRAHHTYCISQD
jgi:hypothetical protein